MKKEDEDYEQEEESEKKKWNLKQHKNLEENSVKILRIMKSPSESQHHFLHCKAVSELQTKIINWLIISNNANCQT